VKRRKNGAKRKGDERQEQDHTRRQFSALGNPAVWGLEAMSAASDYPPPSIMGDGSASRPSGEWNEDDFDVLADGAVVGRIFKANASPVGASWMWTLAFGHHVY
jgi:hypothetical protein